MQSESESSAWLAALPCVFATEVVVWTAAESLGMSDVVSDPAFAELGQWLDVDRITSWLAVAAVALSVVISLLGIARHARQLAVSLVQLPGVLALATWWIGASTVLATLVVALSTLGAWWVSLTRANEDAPPDAMD